ncbi:MAG: hypothetical protein LC795_17000 [Acidobacteria bacterium]|nr:hypothetical protein [Acidobacteriota bacterium]
MWWPRACGASGTDDAWAKLKRGGCGIDVREAGGLRSVARLTFMAKGESGREVLEFKVGADDVEPSPARPLVSVTLTRDWRKYEVDLKGADLKRASALFVWAATDAANPPGAIFYLDDIQFEGVK